MNEDEHRHSIGGSMGGNGSQQMGAALTQLRTQLETGRVTRGLNKTQLAQRAGLSRTVVSQALSSSAPPPSPDTIAALARALSLDVQPLLNLLTVATARAPAPSNGLGRPITEWDPHDLEVHPAAVVTAHGPQRSDSFGGRGTDWAASLPSYVRRPHDEQIASVVADAANGLSRIAVLVGSSSTGKTRACWEAVQPLAAQGWRLWHPFDPTRAEAALSDLNRVPPRTVVWLNEAQHYLDAGQGVGERIVAALRTLLSDTSRRPILVLGTLWPEYATAYTARPQPGHMDPYSQVRELLSRARITLPDAFDADATDATRKLAAAGDRRLAHALEHARDGRLTQYLAGAPELLHRYETASPPARAILHAAMDARRLGVGLHLPLAFLEGAAADYLTDDEYSTLAENWLEQALTETSDPVHGNLAPLRRVRHRSTYPAGATTTGASPIYRLTDYLEQHARRARRLLCPPASFWQSACDHLASEELINLANAAKARHRAHWSHRLRYKASEGFLILSDHDRSERLHLIPRSRGRLLYELAELRESAGDPEGAASLLREASEAGDLAALHKQLQQCEAVGDHERAEQLLRQAAESGSHSALRKLAHKRETAGDRVEAELLARRLATRRDTSMWSRLLQEREAEGDGGGVQRLLRGPLDSGVASELDNLVQRREMDGDREGAEWLAIQAAAAGDISALHSLALLREHAGKHDEAERLARAAIEAGDTSALGRIPRLGLERPWHQEGGERFAYQSPTRATSVMLALALLRERAGKHDEAERLARAAIEAGDTSALGRLAQVRAEVQPSDAAGDALAPAVEAQTWVDLAERAWMRERAGDHRGAEHLARQAAYAGNFDVLIRLAWSREGSDDRARAEELLRQAVDAGSTYALRELARLRGIAGAHHEAERLIRQAMDAGGEDAIISNLAELREAAGDREGAEQVAGEAAERGNPIPLRQLALTRARAHDYAGAERLARQAARAGSTVALVKLAEAWERAGDCRGAERLALQAADAGDASAVTSLSAMRQGEALWPYGLDPDGTPSSPWEGHGSDGRP
ncbi:helix-turn-helix domain-containing protein [Streptomyces shaanxiensis]|uniref:HTH cro/C1-type domain-containing protein n=1 Tax=Streptomyces shaanxiensis TaxID=653357 RepID=A0ABP7VBX2_9ACTN